MVESSPHCLYRVFSKQAYAESFISGKIRFSLLSYYTKIEDEVRKDKDEGISKYQYPSLLETVVAGENGDLLEGPLIPGNMQSTGMMLNPIYILCTSGPDVSHVTLKKFGQFIVRVNKPERLRNDLEEASKKKFGLKKVRYDKNLVVVEEMSHLEKVELTFSQKTKMFSYESEYRYITIFPPNIPSETHIEVNINNPMDYLEILS